MRKFLLILAAVFLVLSVTVYIYLSRNLGSIITRQIYDKTGFTVSYSSFDLNIFKGFSLKGTEIIFPDDSVKQKIDEVNFKYSFRELFRRKVKIVGIEVVSPSLEIYQDKAGRWNFEIIQSDSGITAMDDSTFTESVPDKDFTETKFPVIFEISEISVENMRLMAYSNFGQFFLEGENFRAADFYFNSFNDFTSSLSADKININAINFEFPQFNTAVISDMNCAVNQDSLSLLVQIGISSSILDRDLGNFTATIDLKGYREGWIVKVDRLDLDSEIPGEISFKSSWYAENILSKPLFSGSVKLHELSSGYLEKVSQIDEFNLGELEWIRPAKIKLKGEFDIDSGKYQAEVSADEYLAINNFRFPDPDVSVERFESEFLAEIYVDNDSVHIVEFLSRIYATEIYSSLLTDSGVDISLIDAIAQVSDDNLDISSSVTLSENSTVEASCILNLPQNLLSFLPRTEYLQELSLDITDLLLDQLSQGMLQGIIEGSVTTGNSDSGFIFNSSLAAVGEIALNLPDTSLSLPFDFFNCEGIFAVPETFDRVDIKECNFNVSNYLTGRIYSQIAIDSLQLTMENITLNLNEFLKYPIISAEVPDDIQAYIEVSGNVAVNPMNPLDARAEVEIFIPPFNLNYLEYEAKGISLDILTQFTNMTVHSIIEYNTDSLYLGSLRRRPSAAIGATVELEAVLRDNYPFNYSYHIDLFNESTISKGKGAGSIQEGIPQLSGELSFKFDDQDAIEVIDGHYLSGALEFALDYAFTDFLSLEGEIVLDKVALKSQFFGLSGAEGRVDFLQDISLEPLYLVKRDFKEDPFYWENRPYFDFNDDDSSNVKIANISVLGWELTGLEADVLWEQSIFQIENFGLFFFDGNLNGNGWVRVDSLLANDFSYAISADGAELNTSLMSKSKGSESSRLSFTANMRGRQFDPLDNLFDLDGNFFITKISPRVAENILIFMDPRQEDKGIQTMRFFLSKGWGIRSFSFEMNHGFVYSTIVTQQPPFAKPLPFIVSRIVPIEKEIRFSRLPIKFFLQ